MAGEDVTNFEGSFFTLQNFLPGKIKGCWNDLSKFTPQLLDSYFGAVAEFARAVKDFKYKEKGFKNYSFKYFAVEGEKIFLDTLESLPNSVGKKLLVSYKTDLLKFIRDAKTQFLKSKFDTLPKQLIHFDWHPGNVLYKGTKISAIFDLDWALFDARLGDVAAAIGQSCYYYGGKNGGKFRKDRIERGLRSYRLKYGKSEFSRDEERFFIKTALRVYMWYMLLWSIGPYDREPTTKNLIVLRHYLNALVLNDFDSLF